MRNAIAAFSCILVMGLAHGAQAQGVCASRQQLLQSLAQDYKEAPMALGMSNDGNVIELLSAKGGKTWTLMITTPDGISCVVAAGESWEQIDPQTAQLDPEA